MLNKFEITQSKIHLFEKCGKAFEFRYLQDWKVAPQAALTVGRSVDDGITHNLQQKIQTKKDVSKEEVVEATLSTFNRESIETDWQGEDPGAQKDIAVKLVSAHHEKLAPLINPKAVQLKLQVDLPEYTLAGTLDLVEQDDTLADSKTSKTMYDENAVAWNLQPAVYTYLYEKNYGIKAPGFRYDVMVKPTKTIGARTQVVSGVVSEKQKTVALLRADSLNRAVQSGNFHYAPDNSWYCSEKWCGFWSMCDRGGK